MNIPRDKKFRSLRSVAIFAIVTVTSPLFLVGCSGHPVKPPDPRTEKAKASDARVEDSRQGVLASIEARIEAYSKILVDLKGRTKSPNAQQRVSLQNLERTLTQAKQDLRDVKKANGSSFDRFRARLEAALSDMQKTMETMPTARENPEGA